FVSYHPPLLIPLPHLRITMVLLPLGFLKPLYRGSSSSVKSTTPPPHYPFDESIFAELDNSLWIIPRPLGSEPVLEKPNELDACRVFIAGISADRMVPKKTSTSTVPAMTQAAIRKLVANSVAVALEKAMLASSAGLNELNWYFLVATVPRTTK
nr:hypothetical protein [Tanacetum cinerariifolium]